MKQLRDLIEAKVRIQQQKQQALREMQHQIRKTGEMIMKRMKQKQKPKSFK